MNRSSAALLVVAIVFLSPNVVRGGECHEYYKRAYFDAQVASSRTDSTFVPNFDPLFCWDEPESTLADMFIDALRDSTVSKRMKIAVMFEASYGAVTAAWPGIEPYIDAPDEDLRVAAWSAVVNLLKNGRGPELQGIDWRATFFRVFGVPTAELNSDCPLYAELSVESPALGVLPRGTVVSVRGFDLGAYKISTLSGSGYVYERYITSTTALATLRFLSSYYRPHGSRQ